MTEEEKRIIMENALYGIVPPPNGLKFLARKKGIQTMKEQAKRLRQLEKDGGLKDEPMAEWLSKPLRKNPKTPKK